MSDNPLLAPIHGVSLEDYAAICARLADGVAPERLCEALGVEPAVWEEVNVLWPKRMQEDGTYSVIGLFGQYFATAADHPKFAGLGAETSEEGQANLQRLGEDRLFYEELNGARTAAYEYGLDGAQWILEEFGISLGEFQAVASQWNERTRGEDSEATLASVQRQEEAKARYAARFAEQQGGNIADDIEF